MRRWSKLQKELYLITDENIDFQIHCCAYRMKSRYGGTDLPRYWITLNKEIIFDYPKDFAVDEKYPYYNDIRDISQLLGEYIDTPVDELFSKKFERDKWGLCDILKAADKRIGKRRMPMIAEETKNKAAEKIIKARNEKK